MNFGALETGLQGSHDIDLLEAKRLRILSTKAKNYKTFSYITSTAVGVK